MDNRIHPSWAASPTQRTAIVTQGAPQYLSSDNDPLFQYHRWQANLRILDVTEVKTVPFVPHSRPFVERLIGTIRREQLDHTRLLHKFVVLGVRRQDP